MYTDNYMRGRTPRREVGGQSSCRCGRSSESRWGVKGYPLASVYAPVQEFSELYSLDEALLAGTMFKQLDLPFLCGQGAKGGGCRG